jgi:peptidyl-prolyl cis-trans isomerase C
MKKNYLLNMFLVLLLSAGFVVHANKIGIAATVQGEDISEVRLQNSIDSYLKQQGTNVGAIRDPKRFKAVRESVLEVLIGQELLWQAAYKSKLIASDEEISQAYKQYQEQFADEMSFNIKIQEGGFNKTTFQEYLKRQLSAQKWIQKFVAKEVNVDEPEVHAFYLENQQKFIQPEKIRARHILIQAKPQAGNEEKENASRLLAGIKQEIDSGASFETLAKEKSQDSSAAAGGDLGYFERGQMVKPFENAAFSLVPGEVSGIIETRFGFHLIQLVDRKPPVQYEEKDLVEKIRPYLWQQKYQRAVQDAVTVLEESALIEKSAL